MPTVAVGDGVDLYYEERGAGVPILGIHGTPSSAVLWESAAAELATYGRCLIYDRRGVHRSPAPVPFESVDLADHVRDAVGLLTALSATPAVVIGRSTGGLIALELARRHPDLVVALVLLEPAIFSLDPRAATWAAGVRERLLEHVALGVTPVAEAMIREALGDETWLSFPEPLRDLLVGTGPAVLAEVRGSGFDLSGSPLTLEEEDLAALTPPTLVVSSEDGPQACRLVDERLAEGLPDAEAALVPGGHIIHPAHPAVLDFVARHGGDRAP
ncbi:alpha/beta fold hydrolase [Nocardioides donggukensis]|uniref:Alpha/beta hydrolase n=1 Tax=Nocardioides donggukensis TaxID=2774019 RepID=A0A927PZA8_9ACTN|nr:alpha/beta hydrolase [Nocardioides donggukensis]MBD8868785.1 alpha/beta hydrolase [Nocardioides donggukensis]